MASRKGHPNVVQLLLDHGADINARTADGRTPLSHASSTGATEVVRLLIERCADLDSQDDDTNWTPLHWASNMGHVDVAKLLLKHGADVDMESITKLTSLDVASLEGKFEVVQTLRAHFSNTKFQDIEDWSMVTAIRKGRSDIVESLLERGGDVNTKLGVLDGLPALHYVSYIGFFEIAQLLLKWGANVDLRVDGGLSALHLAARSCQLDIATLLLENRANINARNKNHDTPLLVHLASLFGQMRAVQLLLKRGANPHLQNSTGETPSQSAAARGYHDITRLLPGESRA